MNEMFSQGGKGSVGIQTSKQAIARHFGVKQSEVVYYEVGKDIAGYKVIYDKVSQRSYSLPTNPPAGTVIVSFADGVLTLTGGVVDLGALAVTRGEYVTLPGSFTSGATLTAKNELLVYLDSKYRWGGTFPKTIPANSTPASTGGVSNSAWIPQTDPYLQTMLTDGSFPEAVKYKYGLPTVVDGTVYRTVQDKLDNFVNVLDFGAKGDGVTNDSAAFTAAKNYVTSGRNVLALTGGEFNLEDIPATPSGGFGNDIKGLYVRSNKPSVFGVVEGSASKPNQTIDPSLWVQKIVRKDNPGDPYAHNIGAIYGGVVAKGDGVNVTNGTWMSGLFNCKLDGAFLGSGVSDVKGNAIGLAGFAESVKPAAGHITCGVWAVGSSPTLTTEEFSNFSGNFSTVGAEINLNINHPQAALGDGKGESAGLLINNYRKGSDYPSAPTVRDISYGLRLNGTDINGEYTSNNVDIYSGYQVGIKLDKIKNYGIEFGKYMANGAIGIKFPNNYAGMERRMDTGIALGNHKINLGEYTGSYFFDSDLWLNSGNLYFKTNDTTRTILGSTGVGTTTNSTATHTIRVNIGGVLYDILARKV